MIIYPPPPFLFVKTIEKVMRLCTVVVLKIWAFFTYFIYLSVMGRYNPPPPIKTKLKYVKNANIFKTTTQKKTNTVHNLITFSIVFTNKNGPGIDSTPPHQN